MFFSQHLSYNLADYSFLNNMSWTNYHSHCKFCDGSDQPYVYAEAAVDEGLLAYGFSSHAPTPFYNPWAMDPDNLRSYVREIKQLRDAWKSHIQIYCGLEVDYVPGVMGPKSLFIRNAELDYTIGSVHFVDKFLDGKPWEIDNTPEIFEKGLKDIFIGNVQKAVSRYFELTRQMVLEECPDIIGHIDKIKMQNLGNKYFNENEDWYRDEVIITLDLIKHTRAIVEVNTRGYYKQKTTETYPSEWILKELYKRNIPVTITSDAHAPSEITAGFEYAADLLKSVGFEYVYNLFDGKWRPFRYSKNGLALPVRA